MCVQTLAQWLAEDSDACERGDVHAALPFMLAVQQPPAPVAADAAAAAPASVSGAGASPASSESAEAQSVLAVLLPALLFLCTNADALAVLREQRLAPRLVRELILPEYGAGVERQLALLSEAATAADASNSGLSARERQEIREALLAHVGSALATVGNACTVLSSLCSGGGGGGGPAESIESVRPLWPQLQPVLNSCLKIASQCPSPRARRVLRDLHVDAATDADGCDGDER